MKSHSHVHNVKIGGVMARLSAAPVTKAIAPMVGLIDDRPAAALTAFKQGKPLSVTGPDFDPDNARRLHEATADLVASFHS